MATYKRRIVYLSDEEWTKAGQQAERYELSISGYFRSLIVGGAVTPPAVREEFDRIAAERFSTRPFTPVPKVKK